MDNEALRRLVLSQPIPDRLIVNIADAPLVEHHRRHASRLRDGRAMTPPLWETLKLVAAGRKTADIATELGVPFYTAQDRVKRLLAYFDARDRMDIVVRCYREGIM